jgi:hypothetical protein
VRLVRAGSPVGAIALALLLGACGTTVVETPPTAAPLNVTTTTEAVPPTTTDQLDELVDSALSLGDLIFDGDPDASLAHIDAVWKAATPAVQAADSDIGLQLAHEVGGLHTAVDRKRPADADKAARNIENLVHLYLQRHPDS